MSEFRDFCVAQVMRLSQQPRWPFHAAGVNEIVNFVENRSGGRRDEVLAVINEAVQFEQCPSVADLGRLWMRLFPRAASQPCELCRGHIGYTVITRADGLTGAVRCPCGATGSLEYSGQQDEGARKEPGVRRASLFLLELTKRDVA